MHSSKAESQPGRGRVRRASRDLAGHILSGNLPQIEEARVLLVADGPKAGNGKNLVEGGLKTELDATPLEPRC